MTKQAAIDTLPPPNIRWVPSRKLAVIEAIRSGTVTRSEVLERYAMTEHELGLWEKGLKKYGKKGVMVTRIQSRDLR